MLNTGVPSRGWLVALIAGYGGGREGGHQSRCMISPPCHAPASGLLMACWCHRSVTQSAGTALDIASFSHFQLFKPTLACCSAYSQISVTPWVDVRALCACNIQWPIAHVAPPGLHTLHVLLLPPVNVYKWYASLHQSPDDADTLHYNGTTGPYPN